MKDYIHIRDFIRRVNKEVPESPMQTQYLARYLTGMPGYPDVCAELRVRGEAEEDRTKLDYYQVMIHKDDLPVFIERLREYYRDQLRDYNKEAEQDEGLSACEDGYGLF